MLNNIAAVLGVSGAPDLGAYNPIQTFTAPAGSSSIITFSSIPSTYKHLQLRIMARTTTSGTGGAYLNLRCNADTAGNYTYHDLQGVGSGTPTASGLSSQTATYIQRIPTDGETAGINGVIIVDILDYTSTSKNKTIRSLGGYDANGSGRIYLTSGAWLNSSTAVSQLDIFPDTNNFKQYSSFALYGIKG